MVRKISFFVISLGILSIGYIAFRNLSYWDKSIRIFKYDPGMAFEGRVGRGGFEGRGNSRGREDFLQPEVSGRGFERPRGNVTDSLRRDSGGNRLERPGAGREIRDGERRGRGGFPSGRKINLRNVYWFLAVFASFTVLVIYIDKAVNLIKKKSGTKPCMTLDEEV